ncbi:tetratricopeptide repeat protein [Agromyces mangrovi Wang et al. 2018]|uniref:tetratricopeptide repeat protein n=1 Tax=Agromyces mangrovi TaxID=1858653 RepID=UPI002573658F|nr:tetratricopeptide repeat protein [Agromyces mangrovi]
MPDPSSMRGAVDLSSLASRRSAPQPPAANGSGPAAGEGGPVPASALVVDATDQSFGQVVELSKRVPVVVDLWAEWCAPCKQLTPVLEQLVAEYAGRIVLAKVDVDANPQLAQAFQAQSIPTVAAVVAGQPVPLFTGAQPEQVVREVFEQLLQLASQHGVNGRVDMGDAPAEAEEPVEEPLPEHVQEAYDAIERGDYEAAAAAYRTALAKQPSDAEAKAGLAQVSLLARLQGRGIDEIRQAAASAPDDVDAQLAVADLDCSGGHVDDAFDRLLTLFAKLAPADRDPVRARLLELFEVVGIDDPRVGAARRRLASLLY